MPMPKYARRAGTGCSGRGDELAVLDAFHADKPVGELSDTTVGAAQDQGFEALVFVQVDMQCRGNKVQCLVLGLGKFAAEVWNVVIVYERNACYSLRRFVRQDFFGECAAGQVAQCFGARCIALSLDELVEFDEEIFFHLCFRGSRIGPTTSYCGTFLASLLRGLASC